LGWNGIRNEIFFPFFPTYLSPVWIEILSEWCFLIFWVFFLHFSSLGQVGTEFRTNFFFLSFSTYLNPVWIEIMSEWFFFWILLLFFFRIFLLRSCRNKIRNEDFSLFLDLSQPGLDRYKARMMFFNFLNSFWNFLARVRREQNSERKFYLSFSSYLSPVWIEILPEWCFFTFRYFFWNFLAQVRKERNSKRNFFSLFPDLSQPGLDRNNAGMMYFNFLFFFFGIF